MYQWARDFNLVVSLSTQEAPKITERGEGGGIIYNGLTSNPGGSGYSPGHFTIQDPDKPWWDRPLCLSGDFIFYHPFSVISFLDGKEEPSKNFPHSPKVWLCGSVGSGALLVSERHEVNLIKSCQSLNFSKLLFYNCWNSSPPARILLCFFFMTVNLLLSTFNPLKWLASNFSLQYHPWITH